MSTVTNTPNLPAPTPAPAVVPSTTSTVSGYLKVHQALIIAVLAGLLIWFLAGKVESAIAAHDNATLAAQQVVTAAQVKANQALAAQVAEQAAQYKTLADTVEKQNAALEQANVSLATALTKQQKTDTTLTLPDLATRWNTLIPATVGGLSVNNGQLAITDTAAHATVNELERVPVLQGELTNSQSEKINVDKLLTASTAQVDTLNSSVKGLSLQITDNDKVCKDQLSVVTADARKSKRKWFYAGFITGFIARQLIKP